MNNIEEDIERLNKLVTTKFNNDYSIDNIDKEAIQNILSKWEQDKERIKELEKELENKNNKIWQLKETIQDLENECISLHELIDEEM